MAPPFFGTKLGLAHGNKQLLEGAKVQEFRIFLVMNSKSFFNKYQIIPFKLILLRQNYSGIP